MKKNNLLIAIFTVLLMLTSCSDSNDTPQNELPIGRGTQLTLPADDAIWTYYSLEEGRKIGTSAFGNNDEDNQWKQRTDWDIAVCGDLLKTNGGTSGSGNGALQIVSGDYSTLTEAPKEGYIPDDFQ